MEGDFFNDRYVFNVPHVDFENLDAFDPERDNFFDSHHEDGMGLNFAPPEPKKSRDETPSLKARRSLRNTPIPEGPPSQSQSYSRRRTRSAGPPQSAQGSAKAKLERRPSARRDGNYRPAGLCTSLTDKYNKKDPPQRNSPNHAKRVPVKTSSKGIKSSEQLELEKIEALRLEAQKQKKRAERSHRRVLSSGPTQNPKPTTASTKVEEFSFATDKRIINESKPVKANSTDTKDFSTMLRHYEPSKVAKKGVTIPIDTNLHLRKRKHSEERAAFKEPPPLWSKTPERFHSLPRNAKFMPPSNKRRRSLTYSCKITRPVTPKLESGKRNRPVHVMSQEELEEKQANDIKNYKFKARPFNDRRLALPEKKVYEATVAVSPCFATDKRIEHYHATREDEDHHHSFRARPLPKRILEAPQGIKTVDPKPITHAKSPAFALKYRLRSANKSDLDDLTEEDDHVVRANPMPNMDEAFVPKIQRSVVRVEPFSQEFEARNEQAQRHKAQKLAQMREEQEKVLEEQRAFKARHPEVLRKDPFLPKKSTLPLTDVSDIKLNTSRRSEKRQEWETYKSDNERLMAQLKQEQDEKREEEERREVDRLRREAVHKAQPVRHYKNVIVQKSTLPLTRAQSPHLTRRLRERNTNVL